VASIDVINKPLTQAQRTSRYEELLQDPRYRNVICGTNLPTNIRLARAAARPSLYLV
jgi:hypothetical protein